jgi:hypothetical protein
VRQHLRGCEECTGVLDGFKSLAALAAKWIDAPPPYLLRNVLTATVDAACKAATASGQGALRRMPSGPTREAAHRPLPPPIADEPAPAGAKPKRGFKPMLEGLEDRYPLTCVMGAAGIAVVLSPFASAAALRLVEQVCTADCIAAAYRNGWSSPAETAFPPTSVGAAPWRAKRTPA